MMSQNTTELKLDYTFCLLKLFGQSLKKVGTHFIKIRLHADVEVQLKVSIEATEATKEDEKKAVKTAKAQIEEASVEVGE